MTDETDARELTVVDDEAAQRFEIRIDGHLAAFTHYRLEEPGTYAFMHTSTMPAFAGQGVATTLIHEVFQRLRGAGSSVLPYCPFVNSYIRKHPEDADLVPVAEQRRFGVGA